MHISIFIILLSFCFADYGGGYAGSGFRYGSNAREIALAGALIADDTPGFYVFSNPALLHFAKSYHAGFSWQSISLDRSIISGSIVKNLPPSAGMGLAIIRAGTDNISGKDGMNQFTEYFSTQEIAGIMSFGVGFSEKIAAGLNIKAVFSTIADDYSGDGIAADVGILYSLSPKITLGAKMENITGGFNWNIDMGEDSRSYEENFPKTIAVGGVYSGIKTIRIFLQHDMILPPEQAMLHRSRMGAELTLAKKIDICLGLKQKSGSLPYDLNLEGINFSPTIGAGLPIRVWNEHFLTFHYALDTGSVGEGISHLFSFTTEF